MPALIPELIALASDPAVKTADLLRKALVAAHRLQLPEWVTWLGRELNGYGSDDAIPAYRHVQGEVLIDDYHGLKAVVFPSAESAARWQLCTFDTPVDEIEGWCAESDDIHMQFSPREADALRAACGTNCTPLRRFTLASMSRILGAVRNQILNWALQLEKEGILGEGLSFTSQERQQAQQVAPVTHIHINGDAHGLQLMQNSPGGQQQQTVTSAQKEAALAALLPWLQQVIAQGQLQGEAYAELQAELDTLKAQAASPKPKWPVIGAVANSVRAILEGAGGGVLAAQALGWLATLSGS
ncbi:hypothetical protein [Aeromonas hydrophila]|uniref:AbiTii domain-containing protein n=1 Tax=Aeromonas hydrophila TaxID=644 RepID=UPI003EC5EE82